MRETLDYAQRLNPTFAQFHLAKAFFDHQEWAELGNIEGSWMQSGAGINGLPYTPNGLARSTLYKAMLQAYLGFYVRPGKLTEILRTMKSKQDLMRNARGVWQIVRHLGEIRGTT